MVLLPSPLQRIQQLVPLGTHKKKLCVLCDMQPCFCSRKKVESQKRLSTGLPLLWGGWCKLLNTCLRAKYNVAGTIRDRENVMNEQFE